MLRKSGSSWRVVCRAPSKVEVGSFFARCARGVARWWVIEYYEREKGTIALAFRRYCNATRGLKQIAVWLGVAEYDGIWRHQNRAGTSNGVAGIATIQGRIDGSNRQEHGRRNHINSAE